MILYHHLVRVLIVKAKILTTIWHKNESGGIIDQNVAGKNDVPIVKDVIQFFAFPKLDDNRVITVGTRHNYKDPRDPRPYKQSCYILVGKPAVMINLSSKKGEGSIL